MAPTSRNQQRPPRRQRPRRRTSAAIEGTRPAMAEALARGLGCDSAPTVSLRRR